MRVPVIFCPNSTLRAVLLSGVFFLSIGCGERSHSGKKIFHYNESSGIASLDPAFAKSQSVMWAVHQLYNTLVEPGEDLSLRPSLARSWTIDSSKTVYTFRLRNDVFFHDDPVFPDGKGRRLVASDLVYSLSRIIDPQTASPGAWIFNDKLDSLQPFSAPDDTTFRLKLSKPFQPIIGILSMPYCSVVAREAVNRYGNDFRRHPVGSGPFRMLAWEEGQALVLTCNARYFETDSAGSRLPYLDGVFVHFLDSKATEFLSFRQGKLDFINDIDASYKDELLTGTGELRKEWESRILLQKHPYLNIEYLGILADTNNPVLAGSPLKLKKIRQAINYGFDRRKLIRYMRNSIGTAAESGFVPMGLPSFNSEAVKGYRYEPEITGRLLEEAGFPGGKGLPTITLQTIPQYADLATFIANELGRSGIPIKIETLQKSLLLEQTAKSKSVFFRGSWIADYPDAQNYLSVFYGKNPAPPNYTRYRNAAFDVLYERALMENRDTTRYELYRTMDRMVIADAPVVPLWYDMAIHLVQPRVSGFHPNALNMLELRRADKTITPTISR
jgi:peptide/nickel transport system substrate-binding protein